MVCKHCLLPIIVKNPDSTFPYRHVEKERNYGMIICSNVGANKGKLLGGRKAEPMEVKDYLKLLKKHGV